MEQNVLKNKKIIEIKIDDYLGYGCGLDCKYLNEILPYYDDEAGEWCDSYCKLFKTPIMESSMRCQFCYVAERKYNEYQLKVNNV